ncbi:putative proline-rich receptor-like protein kinase PERK6 [Cornus florida]|uniref:putative proline-rich receptor-like protein kinase PERK6 n=1 Tax=Cornus florida TaxID=4283 RepID=UPI00289FDEEE|nr:putative proline-rich receptor-like protein kinase PERK6 [Cornus florida]
MGLHSGSSLSPSPGETVMVVMNVKRSKGSLDALDWAIKHLVQPRDRVIVLGLLYELGKRTCFPFGIDISNIWVKLEFAGQGEMNPRDLEEEIERKKEEYQCTLEPFYRRCKRNEVELEIKLAAGYDPRKLIVEEAQNFNPRWIILDSHLKREKMYIYGHVACNVAIMKGKDFATLMPSKLPVHELWLSECRRSVDGISEYRKSVDGVSIADEHEKQDKSLTSSQENKSFTPSQYPQTPQTPCWYPLSWRTGFPRPFTISEVERITNGFADEEIIAEKKSRKIYEGIYQETPVLVLCFAGNDDRFWSVLKVLSRVRHRNILNLVGYCCTNASNILLCDYPCGKNLDTKLRSDESAKNLSWKSRWQIALDIGAALRYLHEECADGPIVDVSLCSNSVVFSHSSSALLCISTSARCLMDGVPWNGESPARLSNFEEDERLSGDIRAYGIVLTELITGKSNERFQSENGNQSFIDWALPLLQSGSLNLLMDPRLTDAASPSYVVHHMARAALLCLKNESGHMVSMSEVLAVVQGDQITVTKHLNYLN